MSVLTGRIRNAVGPRPLQALTIIGVTLMMAGLLGLRPSYRWVGLILAAIGATLLLATPQLVLLALVAVALVAPVSINTGTEVAINPTTLLVPAALGIWVLFMVVRKRIEITHSRVNVPLFGFLVAGLVSLVIGHAIWDPAVPRSGNLVLVQLAQWAIFAFSAGVFWLVGNLVNDEVWLKRMVAALLIIGGAAAVLWTIPVTQNFAYRVFTFAALRPPFWLLIAAMSGGQLLFNRKLTLPARILIAIPLLASLIYTFVIGRETVSYWAGTGVVLAVLVWLRFPRLRWIALLLLAVIVVSGQVLPSLYNFAGGTNEWIISGGSRLVLSGRVIDVTMRNPITGLGPAAYRAYARMRPLPYEDAFWVSPNVSSHNNYVDLFAQTGIVGLALFAWFAVEFILLAGRLRVRFAGDFAAGYINGALAAFVAALVIMMLADWILPFVYNISFAGFQASMLVWLFMGGLLVYEKLITPQQAEAEKTDP